MKLFPLTLIASLVSANADLPLLAFEFDDMQMSALSVFPFVDGCSRTEPALSLSKFAEHVRLGRLHGPCRYQMNRSYIGDLEEYLRLTKKEDSEYTNFLFNIKAPKGIVTHIDTIFFEQHGVGSDCASARLSRYNHKKNEPRYYTSLQSVDDSEPRWDMVHVNQIPGGDFLLEVPSKCLVDPSSLVIETLYVYEDVSNQLHLNPDRSKLIKLSDECNLPDEGVLIKSHTQFFKFVRTLSRDCLYRYEREYKWTVPQDHILVDAEQTKVLSQVALFEPMLADQRRKISTLRLGNLSGPGCEDAVVWARMKLPARVPRERLLKSTLENGVLAAEIPRGLDNTNYDFLYVLPKTCELTDATMGIDVLDDNNTDPLSIEEEEEFEYENEQRQFEYDEEEEGIEEEELYEDIIRAQAEADLDDGGLTMEDD